jgi:hypothetical protein
VSDLTELHVAAAIELATKAYAATGYRPKVTIEVHPEIYIRMFSELGMAGFYMQIPDSFDIHDCVTVKQGDPRGHR